jgi:hypothetical protein
MLLQHIWELLELDLQQAQQEELAEQLFQLSCLFWIDMSSTGKTSYLPLVYFSSVLGIYTCNLVYRSAYYYTTFLAGLVWIGRLLLLEYALPAQLYQVLSWPKAAGYPDQLGRLQAIRQKYLCYSRQHAIGRLLEMLYIGCTTAKKEGARSNISWLLDRKVLQVNKQVFNIAQFQVIV